MWGRMRGVGGGGGGRFNAATLTHAFLKCMSQCGIKRTIQK